MMPLLPMTLLMLLMRGRRGQAVTAHGKAAVRGHNQLQRVLCRTDAIDAVLDGHTMLPTTRAAGANSIKAQDARF
jgi:hypothetical protein